MIERRTLMLFVQFKLKLVLDWSQTKVIKVIENRNYLRHADISIQYLFDGFYECCQLS